MGNCCLTETTILKNATLVNTPDIIYTAKRAKVLDVYDGDTVTLCILINNEPYKVKARLYGIDCCEIKDHNQEKKQRAVEAREYVKTLILGKIVNIEILNNTYLNGRKIQEKYGRLLVRIETNNKDLCETMLEKGYGKEYYGGHKEDS